MTLFRALPDQAPMAEDLDDLGFSPAYRIEADPEEPWSGEWDCPVYGYGRHGRESQDYLSGLRTLAVRVTPDNAPEWVGIFVAGSDGGPSGFYGCPSADDLCIVAEGLAYVVDVTAGGEHAAKVIGLEVRRVVRALGLERLLLVSTKDIVTVEELGVGRVSLAVLGDDLPSRDSPAGPNPNLPWPYSMK